MRNSWEQLRSAGATARAMLVAAAARRWQVDPAQISVVRGVVRGPHNEASFGDLVHDAARIQLSGPAVPKSPQAFTLIGKHVPRIDSAEKSSGRARYTIDMDLPGLLHACVLRPPRFGAMLANVDATDTRAIDGVVDVLEIPSGVAVVAESYWSALKGRRALRATWLDNTGESRGSEAISAALHALIDTPGAIAAERGDVDGALASAAKTVSAVFEFPYLAHAAMEPLNAVVAVADGRCEIWTGCQSQTRDQAAAAAILGFDTRDVTIHTLYAGGSFGRRRGAG